MDPISPELALVDPDLRRAAIARLDAQAFFFVPARVRPIPVAAAVSSRQARSWPRRASQAVLLLGLLVAGLAAASVAARDRAAGPVLLTNAASGGATTPPASPALPERSALESQLLSLIVQSPAERLPAALIDARTGLPRNNLQAVCSRTSGRRYLCVVRPALHRPGEGLYVRYGPSGFTWTRYRRG